MNHDHRDLVITEFADNEQTLLDHIVELTIAYRAERELRHAAVYQLSDLTRQLERQREQHLRLLDEYRHLRTQTMRQAVAA